jgi:predicted HTH domain antitoxin
MQTLTEEEYRQSPLTVLDAEHRNGATLVTVQGQAALLAVPLHSGAPTPETLVDMAATLFDQELISLGMAARIAGLSYSEMINELGRREIAVVRYSVEDLKRELAYVSTIAGR